MNSSILELVLSMLAGAALGLFYFGGLWLTVRRIPASKNPALLALGSFFLRTAGVVAGIFLVMGGRWERALACLLGILIARIVLVQRLRHEPEPGASTQKTTS